MARKRPKRSVAPTGAVRTADRPRDQQLTGRQEASKTQRRNDRAGTSCFRTWRAERRTCRPSARVPDGCLLVIAWALSGPLFGFSDTWQLVINTSTTIVTFLMVFLIQHTQNRDTLAVQLKLAELIIAVKGAENRLGDRGRPVGEGARRAARRLSAAGRRDARSSRIGAGRSSNRRVDSGHPLRHCCQARWKPVSSLRVRAIRGARPR